MAIKKVGILGGGQLAQMMALVAQPMGLKVSILANHASDPAAQVVGSSQLGSLTDEAVLRKFLAEQDYVTFESEFVDTAKLTSCLPSHVKAFPHPPVLETLQDRLTQKQLLDKFKIPTSPWIPVESRADLHKAAEKFPQGFVLKQRRFGYDGYGTFVFKNLAKDLDESVMQRDSYGFIAEAFVDFKRELAVSFVRSREKKFLELPLVESVQRDSRCFSVQGPVKHAKLSKLTSQFKRLMQELDYHGILAVELFDGKNLLVNELAPRVHNSAHYSQDGLTCSQFEYHLRAGLGLPLPKVELIRPGFAMVNLLGEGNSEIKLSAAPTGHLHWYGKTENRKGRKLGHINVMASSGKKALLAALKWRKEFQL